MPRDQRHFLRIGIASALLVSAPFIIAQASEERVLQDPDTTVSVAPERYADAGIRLSAAREDARREAKRIQHAQDTFTSDLKTDPKQRRDYIVSFVHPVSAARLLRAAPVELDVRTFFAWLQADPKSIYIATGIDHAESIGWNPATPDTALRTLQSIYLDHVRSNAEALTRAAEAHASADDETRQRLDAQRQAAVTREDNISSAGVSLYGIRCLCSPAVLDQLEEASLIKIRAMERTEPLLRPIPPYDPVRNLIIATEGRYGR